jgi:hypothetical protein
MQDTSTLKFLVFLSNGSVDGGENVVCLSIGEILFLKTASNGSNREALVGDFQQLHRLFFVILGVIHMLHDSIASFVGCTSSPRLACHGREDEEANEIFWVQN